MKKNIIVVALVLSIILSSISVWASEPAAYVTNNDVVNYDVWLAQTTIEGFDGDYQGMYKLFINMREPVYKELGGYLVEDEPLMYMSSLWSVCLNSEYRNQFLNEQKYIYEVILMDYLKYEAENDSIEFELENNAMKYSMDLYEYLSDELLNNTYDYISEMTVDEAIAFYNDAVTINNLDVAISNVKDGAETVKELIDMTSEYLALQQVKDERVCLLKAARDNCEKSSDPDWNFIEAVDELIEILQGGEVKYVQGQAMDYLWNQACDFAWDKLCDANPVLKTINLAVDTMDVCFDTTNKASNNLKLAVLYITDNYLKLAMFDAAGNFRDNNTIANGQTFNACFRAYAQFQMYGNSYANKWLGDFIDSGIAANCINEIKNRENLDTAEDLITYSNSQIKLRERLLEIVDSYGDVYQNSYGSQEWKDEICSEDFSDVIDAELLADFTFDDVETGFIGGKAIASGTFELPHIDGKDVLYLNGTSTNFLEVKSLDGSSLLTGYDEITVMFDVKILNDDTQKWMFYAAPDDETQEANYEKYIGILGNEYDSVIGDINDSNCFYLERYNNSGERPDAPAAHFEEKWVNVCAVFDQTSTSIYIDGIKMDEVTSGYSLTDILGSSSVLYIGKANWGTEGEYFHGWIDDYKIYGKALSSAEIQKVVGKSDIVDYTEVLANFTFDDNITGFYGGEAVATGNYTIQNVDGRTVMYLDGSSTNYLEVTKSDGSSLLTGYDEITVMFDMKVIVDDTQKWMFYAAPNDNTQEGYYETYIGILGNERYVLQGEGDNYIYAERFNKGTRPEVPGCDYTDGWANICVVYDESSTRIYIDGNRVDEVDSKFAISDILGDSSILYIGKANWNTESIGEYFSGWLDNYKIFGKALSDVEVKKEYYNNAVRGEKGYFQDVNETDWFYDAVAYNYSQKLMTGMDDTHFGPYESLSRAQFATILYRMNNSPKVDYEPVFRDVGETEWYADAVYWAYKNGIVTGYSSAMFGPADMITREQMAVMMHRYANYLGLDISARADYSSFVDAHKVSPFATEAMEWAIGSGIITGKENGTLIDPQGNTARAECAVIIQRFIEKYNDAAV